MAETTFSVGVSFWFAGGLGILISEGTALLIRGRGGEGRSGWETICKDVIPPDARSPDLVRYCGRLHPMEIDLAFDAVRVVLGMEPWEKS